MRKREFNILLVRADRIGDVILSTPAFKLVKKHFPRARVTVLVAGAVAPLLKGMEDIDEVLVYEPERRHTGLAGAWRLFKEFRARRFKMVVCFQTRWVIAAACFFAGIRYRVGPYSKLHSYFFFNRGIRQNRSQVEMHEADYNIQLLRRIGIRERGRKTPTEVSISKASREAAHRWLEDRGWNGEKLVIVHPGMGGSALNWPESHYVDLLFGLATEGKWVVLSGGIPEVELLKRIETSVIERMKELRTDQKDDASLETKLGKIISMRPGEFETIEDLGGLLAWATVVVAPSTGPLHLAVALERKVVTFYPPIRVQSALRWGPYLPPNEEHRASVFVPDVFCGEDFRCRGTVCHYFPCMKSIQSKQLTQEVLRRLREPETKKE